MQLSTRVFYCAAVCVALWPAGLAQAAAPAGLPSPEEIAQLPPDGGPDYNRLIFEKSPYLLQHAANPVDWYPWGEEAFEKARAENKPIFLSVGYSTCHWCHVMKRESFEDEEVAALLNEQFVSVKVDREERPDVDEIYMNVTQMMTNSGGWPNTVVMTPDLKPFFAGTYFPKTSRFGQPGVLDILPQLASAWENRRGEVLEAGDKVADALQRMVTRAPGDALDAAILTRAYEQLAGQYDAEHGGFGGAPKFPSPHNVTFMLRHWHRTGDEQALDMATHTLTEMRLGGVYDHIGFGFHRYATDEEWLVPHFEKMLYDQALAVIAYLDGYQATGDALFAQTVRETLAYVQRDMTAPEGGFYSAQDAESEGEEGKFYVWTTDEVRALLGDNADLALRVFNFEDAGNFVPENASDRAGINIPHLTQPLPALAGELGMDDAELAKEIETAREALFAARAKRVAPGTDDKILTDWNGLMIAAFARAGQVLNDDAFTQAASRAAGFIKDRLTQEDGRLHHRYRQGEAGIEAPFDDYAFLIWGLLELYEAGFDVAHLEWAMDLAETAGTLFWDTENGGYFFAVADADDLIVRPKTVYDGASPSGNSVMAKNLLRLGRITGDPAYEEKASELMKAFAGSVSRAPAAHTHLLSALDFGIGPSFEIVIAGEPGAADTQAMFDALRSTYVPNKVVLFREARVESPPIAQIAEFVAYQRARDGKATAYVCQNHACQAPTTDPAEMLRQLTATAAKGGAQE